MSGVRTLFQKHREISGCLAQYSLRHFCIIKPSLWLQSRDQMENKQHRKPGIQLTGSQVGQQSGNNEMAWGDISEVDLKGRAELLDTGLG